MEFGQVTIEPIQSKSKASEFEHLLPPVEPANPEVPAAAAQPVDGIELASEPDLGGIEDSPEEFSAEDVAADPLMEAAEEEMGADPLMEAAAQEASGPEVGEPEAADAAPAWPDPANLDIPELAAEQTPAPSPEASQPTKAAAAEKATDPETSPEASSSPEIADSNAAPSGPEVAEDASPDHEFALEEPAAVKEPSLAVKTPPAAAPAPKAQPAKRAVRAPVVKRAAAKAKKKPAKVAAVDPSSNGSIYDQWSHNKHGKSKEKKPHPLAAAYPEHFVVVCEAGCSKETAHVVYVERRDARGPVNVKPIKKGIVAGSDGIDCVGGCYSGNSSYAAAIDMDTDPAFALTGNAEDGWMTTVKKAKAAKKKSSDAGRWYDRIN